MWALATFVIACLLLNVFVHVSTFFGANPQDWIQPDWLARTVLYSLVGLCVLIANLVEYVQKRRARAQEMGLAPGNPCWFRAIIWLSVAYAIFNVVWIGVIDTARGQPARE